MKKVLFIAIGLCILCSTVTIAQSPTKFNYQAVARDASGGILADQAVGVRLSILSGSATGTSVYSETHAATTNGFGLFNFQIGDGTGATGSLSSIDWSADEYFIKVEFDGEGGTNYTELSTTQLVSVPYALFANDVLNDAVDDADADSTNEIQTLSLNNDMLEISAGNSVDLSGYSSLDNDITNELITGAVLNGSDLEITDAGGTSIVDLSALIDDADADATNELQALTISNDTLFLAPNYEVVLPSQGVGGSNTEVLFNNNGTEDGSSLVYDATNEVFAIGDNTVSDYNLYVYRPGSDYGADMTNIFGLRNGTSGATNGGTSWGIYSVDAAVKGYSYWGNNYSAGVAGYSYFDYGNSIGVIGGDQSGSGWGALGFLTTGYAYYAGYFNGNVGYTGTLSSVSDQRIKTNIEPLTDALEMVKNVDVKTYQYKSDGAYSDMNLAAGKQYGFIAQQLETVVPELVSSEFSTTQARSTEGKGGSTAVKGDALKTVNYIGMIPILTQAIKEQQALIERLEQRISELEAE